MQGVFIQLDELIDRIRLDQDRRKNNKVDEQLSISIFNPNAFENQWINESNEHFIYSQVLINCILQMPITSTEKNEFMTLCRTEYRDNKNEMRIISEFERSYSSDRALWWYTRESFLYKMLVKAFRIQNIDLLFLLRFVIYDIQHQLEENKCLSLNRVYRGQLIASEELKLLKESLGQFISINSFLSAILDRKSALLFLGDSIVSEGIERVLFEIDIDNNDLNNFKAFSNIQSKSYHTQEEILFSIGSVFRLRDIRLGENGIRIIQMTLCSNDHVQLKPIFEYIEEQYGDPKTSPLALGLVLQNMNKFDEAKKFYQWLKKVLPQNHECISQCDNILRTIDINQKIYNKTLESIEDSMETSKIEDSSLAFNHCNMGATYRNSGDLDRALESYNEGLRIWRNSFNEDHQEVGRCYNNIGLIHQQKEEYEKALEYYEKALTILQKYLPMHHPDLITIYSNIGDMHQYFSHYDEALANYIQSLEIIEHTLTPQYSSTVSLMNKIAFVYEEKKDFQLALSYYEKIAESLPSGHADNGKNEQNIQRVLDQLK